MKPIMNVNIKSEVGRLRGVILHAPGAEVASMSPTETAEALYSDIINLSVARREYKLISQVLGMVSNTYEVKDLLCNVLEDENHKLKVLDRLEKVEPSLSSKSNGVSLKSRLMRCGAEELSRLLIEGVLLERDNVERFFSRDRYALVPMYNFFFTRDASMAIGNHVLVGRMASPVRDREAVIMKSIFDFTSEFRTSTIDLSIHEKAGMHNLTIEGGDVLVLRNDVILVGCGMRTSAAAIDALIEEIVRYSTSHDIHLIVQELPHTLESFIHLDMVFTMLDRHTCMAYKPVVFSHGKLRTAHVTLSGGRMAGIKAEDNLLSALSSVGMELEPIFCGGEDHVYRQREQWHSGANFFAVAPGKVLGYARNKFTIEEMNRAGYDIFSDTDVVEGRVDLSKSNKFVVTFDVAELTRGGGGLRCMTMPFNRDDL